MSLVAPISLFLPSSMTWLSALHLKISLVVPVHCAIHSWMSLPLHLGLQSSRVLFLEVPLLDNIGCGLNKKWLVHNRRMSNRGLVKS